MLIVKVILKPFCLDHKAVLFFKALLYIFIVVLQVIVFVHHRFI